jgi:MoxR-like ATPase
VRATHEPYVVLTSNRTRELSEALRRRCLYLWMGYPSLEKEVRIVRAKVSGVGDRLSSDVARFVQHVRAQRLAKVPGVAESLDWARALVALGTDALDEETVEETLGCFLKDESDIRAVRAQLTDGGVAAILAEGAT